MPNPLLIDYLDRCRANYLIESHPFAFTAAEIAEHGCVNELNFAKVVIIKINQGELCMLVLPAPYYVAFEVLRRAIGATALRLATEREFAHRFPRCELGAIPPFGHLYGLRTLMVPVFTRHELIACSAGSHTELLKMPYGEFVQFAHVELIEGGVVPPVAIHRARRTEPQPWRMAV